jgi:hypothetical protein
MPSGRRRGLQLQIYSKKVLAKCLVRNVERKWKRTALVHVHVRYHTDLSNFTRDNCYHLHDFTELVMKYLGTFPYAPQNNFTGRSSCCRAVAKGPERLEHRRALLFANWHIWRSGIDYDFLQRGGNSQGRLTPVIGLPGVVPSGWTSGSARESTVGCRSISATSVSRPWCNRSTFTLRSSSK